MDEVANRKNNATVDLLLAICYLFSMPNFYKHYITYLLLRGKTIDKIRSQLCASNDNQL